MGNKLWTGLQTAKKHEKFSLKISLFQFLTFYFEISKILGRVARQVTSAKAFIQIHQFLTFCLVSFIIFYVCMVFFLNHLRLGCINHNPLPLIFEYLFPNNKSIFIHDYRMVKYSHYILEI